MPNIRAYSLPIAIRQTSTAAAATIPWAMLVPTTAKRPITIRRFVCNIIFDGTAAASTSRYQIARFRSTTPSGGTALTPQAHNLTDKGVGTTVVPSVVTASFLDTGLTVAGIALDTALISMGCARQASSGGYYDLFSDVMETGSSGRSITVDPGDGLAIALGIVAVIGDGIQGTISWDEW